MSGASTPTGSEGNWDHSFDVVVVGSGAGGMLAAICAHDFGQKVVVIELLRREGQSYLELSHRTGVPVGSIGPTRQRALSRLRHDGLLADLAPETSDSRPTKRLLACSPA